MTQLHMDAVKMHLDQLLGGLMKHIPEATWKHSTRKMSAT